MRATVSTPEADAVALRMEKHFGHKVDVVRRGGVVEVRIPSGRFELEPRGGALEVRLIPETEDQLPRLQEVVVSHLDRFARTAIRVEWQ